MSTEPDYPISGPELLELHHHLKTHPQAVARMAATKLRAKHPQAFRQAMQEEMNAHDSYLVEALKGGKT